LILNKKYPEIVPLWGFGIRVKWPGDLLPFRQTCSGDAEVHRGVPPKKISKAVGGKLPQLTEA